MKLRNSKPALLLIDIQKAFVDDEYWGGNRNHKNAEVVCSELLGRWRSLELPIFHVRHNSPKPSSVFYEKNEGFQFQEMVKPEKGEPIITKRVNSAFIGTDLKEQLDRQNISVLIIIGLTTDHCVSTTARMAGNLGYDTYIISDATATFDKVGVEGQKFSSNIIHDTALASLQNEFSTVMKSEKLLALT